MGFMAPQPMASPPEIAGNGEQAAGNAHILYMEGALPTVTYDGFQANRKLVYQLGGIGRAWIFRRDDFLGIHIESSMLKYKIEPSVLLERIMEYPSNYFDLGGDV
jgi:hypothetical protein